MLIASIHAFRWRRICLLAALIASLTGCGSLGPASVQRDRTDYAGVLAATWKEQTLLNIVKLRYADVPVYLDVSSIISSSSLESQVNLGAGWANGEADTQSLGAYGRYTDRPTITYTPLSGEKFSRALLRPISPAVVFTLAQAGYPVDRVMKLTTRAVNGIFNQSAASGRARPADPDFYRLLDALRRVQASEAIETRIERSGGDETAVVILRQDLPDDLEQYVRTVAGILGLPPGVRQVTLTFGAIRRRNNEIALLTRSMTEIFLEIAATLEAPPEHVQNGSASGPPPVPSQPSPWDQPLVRIRSGGDKPIDAYAVVRYRDYWFWIDDTDLRSKSAFTFLLVLLSLAETGTTPQVPVITVPAN